MTKETFTTAIPRITRATSHAITVPHVIFALVVVIFVALRFWKISFYSLWGGEAFSMIGVEQDWRGMFSYVIADIVHPPLFYILLKLWIALGGGSLLWLKLFPVLTSLALLAPFYLVCRELKFQIPEMSLALFLAAVNGYLIHYSQELRMYSLFTFLSMCSIWLFMCYFNSTTGTSGKLVPLTLINLLNIYTHYYGWLVVGMEFLFLLVWQRSKVLKFGLSALILLLAFTPWAYPVIREAQAIGGLAKNLDWIPKPGLVDIIDFYTSLNGPLGSRYLKFLALLLYSLPLVLWFWRIIRSDSKRQGDELIAFSFLSLLSFVPVMAIFLISQRLEQAVWIDRYFVFIAVPYFMLVATAAYRLERAWIRYTWIALIVIWSLIAGFNDVKTNRMAWASPQLGSRVQWDIMTQQLIKAEADPSTPINIYTLAVISKGHRTGDWAISTSIDYFLDAQTKDRFKFVYARDVQDLLNRGPQEEHFWIAFFDLAGSAQRFPGRVLQEQGFRVGNPIVFQQLYNRVVLLPVWRE